MDLKSCRGAPVFFDMLFDLKKYECHLRRIDPVFRLYDDVVEVNSIGENIRLEGFSKFAKREYRVWLTSSK